MRGEVAVQNFALTNANKDQKRVEYTVEKAIRETYIMIRLFTFSVARSANQVPGFRFSQVESDDGGKVFTQKFEPNFILGRIVDAILVPCSLQLKFKWD